MTLRPNPARSSRILAICPESTNPSIDAPRFSLGNHHTAERSKRRSVLPKTHPAQSLAMSASSALVFAAIGNGLGLLATSSAVWFVIGSIVAYIASMAELRRWAVAMLLLSCFGGTPPTCAQSLEVVASLIPDDYKNRRERLQSRLVTYRKSELTAKTKTYEVSEHLKQQMLLRKGEVLGGETIAQLNSLQEWLRSGGEIPPGDELAPLLVDHAQRIAKARGILQREIVTMTRSLEKAELSELAEQLARSFERLGGVLDARSIVADADFKGFRRHDGSDKATKLRVRIETVADNVFIARVQRDWMYRGHPIHRLEGRIDGAIFEAMTGKSLAIGNAMDGSLRYRGYVMGNTILGTFEGRTNRGKPTKGTFRLDKS